MEFKDIKITQADIDKIMSRANPAVPAGVAQDACAVFNSSKPLLLTAVAFLTVLYPPGAAAISAMVAIMEKYCDGK